MPIKFTYWDLIHCYSSFESVYLILPLRSINDFCWIWCRIFYFHFYFHCCVGYPTFDWIFLWNEILASVEFDIAYSNTTLHSKELMVRDLIYSSNLPITLEGYMMLMTQLTSILIMAFNLYHDTAFKCSSQNSSFIYVIEVYCMD